MGAWTKKEVVSSTYAVKASVALFAFNVGEDFEATKIDFEGDALFVILALNRHDDQVQWQSKRLIEDGRSLIANHSS